MVKFETLMQLGLTHIEGADIYIEQLTPYGGRFQTDDYSLQEGELVFLEDYRLGLLIEVNGEWVEASLDLCNPNSTLTFYKYILTRINKVYDNGTYPKPS